MEYIVVSLVAFVVAALVLYSGFGLGTLLMPAFAFFFPVHVAVASTAIVHLANNVFKLTFLGRDGGLFEILESRPLLQLLLEHGFWCPWPILTFLFPTILPVLNVK